MVSGFRFQSSMASLAKEDLLNSVPRVRFNHFRRYLLQRQVQREPRRVILGLLVLQPTDHRPDDVMSSPAFVRRIKVTPNRPVHNIFPLAATCSQKASIVASLAAMQSAAAFSRAASAAGEASSSAVVTTGWIS